MTGAGPHAGDPGTHRLALPVASLAQAHADFLFLFLGMLVALGFALKAFGSVVREYWVLVGVVAAQGLLGVVQYRLGVPMVLVALHVLGSMLVIAALAWLWTALRSRSSPRALG